MGTRRRFGPAPAEDNAPPQLAQPSPSAYPRPQQQDESPQRGRDESPANGASKFNHLLPAPLLYPLFPTWQQRLETFHSSHLHICRHTSHSILILTLTIILTLTCVTSHLLLADPNAPRKRRSRWGDAKADLPGLPTAISATGVSQAQLDNYAIHLRLEEINRKLRLNDFVPPERERYVKKN